MKNVTPLIYIHVLIVLVRKALLFYGILKTLDQIRVYASKCTILEISIWNIFVENLHFLVWLIFKYFFTSAAVKLNLNYWKLEFDWITMISTRSPKLKENSVGRPGHFLGLVREAAKNRH